MSNKKSNTNFKTVKLIKDWQHPAGSLKLKGTELTVDRKLLNDLLIGGFIAKGKEKKITNSKNI